MTVRDVALGGNRVLRVQPVEWTDDEGTVGAVRLTLAWASDPGPGGPAIMVPVDTVTAVVEALQDATTQLES